MTTIVFSKDRALQLHAFLRSFEIFVTPLETVHVLYKSTSARHEKAYREVFESRPWVKAKSQSMSFRNDLLSMIPRHGNLVFFVDDIVFIRPWKRLEIPNLSLRHGIHLTHNYSTAGALQPLPPLYPCGEDMVTWKWSEGILAWGYPLSTDGHIYDSTEIFQMTDSVQFHSPNTLEAAWQQYVSHFMNRWAICYTEAKVVNVPWNRVQTDFENRYSANPTMSADEFLSYWESGKQIDLASLNSQIISSVHQEFPLSLESR